MLSLRAIAVAVAVAVVLWASLDAGFGGTAPAPAGTSAALGMLAVVFGTGAWVMRAGGRPERVPMLVGLALGVGGYALLRLTFPS